MDPLPHILPSEEINDTVCCIRNVFEEELEAETFPLDIAKNLCTYVTDDCLDLKDNAASVLEICKQHKDTTEAITNTELHIINQHADYLVTKESREKNEFLREMMKLKPWDIFTFNEEEKSAFGLIQKCDLYPDLTRQFLDFRFNTTLHRCKSSLSKEKLNQTIPDPLAKKPLPLLKETKIKKEKTTKRAVLQSDPPEVLFNNFELNETYEITIKIKNIGPQLQMISVFSIPKLRQYSVNFEAGQKIAPGMCATGTIKFTPNSFLKLEDCVSFITRRGDRITIPIISYRDTPRLYMVVSKSRGNPDWNLPGSDSFSTSRQRATNSTIDCGSCFLSNFELISLILVNEGYKARFFWLTEENFIFQDVDTITSNLELATNNFWIYPTYFEMKTGEISEVNIIFQPMNCGLQTQSLFLLCDNYTYNQIELVGDGICFSKNLISIQIVGRAREIGRKENHCIFLGHLLPNEQCSFKFSILNTSRLCLNYDVELENNKMSEWFTINKTEPFLDPEFSSDLQVEMQCPREIDVGYHETTIRFFIKDIPIASLEADEEFTIRTNDQTLEEVINNVTVVDVLILDVKMTCYLDANAPSTEQNVEVTCEGCGNKDCSCSFCHEPLPQADLQFIEPILDLGILPVGADIKRDFQIVNLGQEKLKWHIFEFKYNIDCCPHMELAQETVLSVDCGLIKPQEKLSLTLSILRKTPERYLSILVIFSSNIDDCCQEESKCFVAQNICLVTYEVMELNIVVDTGEVREPILCPMEVLYCNSPIDLTFKIKNYSLIPGCYQFLRPIGLEANKVNIEYSGESGILNPLSTKEVSIRLTCYEVGIFENIILPCFVGDGQEPIQVKLLCLVDCIHVFFYLPTSSNKFEKILWPAKVIYEYDDTWDYNCMCGEGDEDSYRLNNIRSEHKLDMDEKSKETLSTILTSQISEEILPEGNNQSLLNTYLKTDPEVPLQDFVMEVKGVAIKEPKKVTIYIENVTPKSAKCFVQATNFSALTNNIKIHLGPTYKKTEEIWEPMIKHHGLVVQPETGSGDLNPFSLLAVDIWIYANTWGIYYEEIAVDIDDIVPFSFSLIIEVAGGPLFLPIGLGSINQYPTLRFGSLASTADPVTRNLMVKNISCIDVTISWHVFNYSENSKPHPFNLICDTTGNPLDVRITDNFFGTESYDLVEIQPLHLEIASGETLYVPLTLKPASARINVDTLPIKCYVLGQILPKEKDQVKPNYFCRQTTSVVICVTGTLETPRLTLEIEDKVLSVFANDVAVNHQTDYSIKCLLRNPTSAIIKADIECSEPFCIRNVLASVTLGPGQCKTIPLTCDLSYELIMNLSKFVYQIEDSSQDQFEMKSDMELLIQQTVNADNKTLKLLRYLHLVYEENMKMTVPLYIQIYYPHIIVRPVHIKFGYVSLGCTQKQVVSVYNLSGCVVLFEVHKSTCTEEIAVRPAFGQVAKTTGINPSFTDVTIYFTPMEIKSYRENVRITTNMPSYYVDISVKGTGTFNEKFETYL